MKKCVFCMVVATGCSVFATERIDSTCYLSTAWDPRTWNSPGIWGGYQYAQGGGIASFALNGAPSDRGQSENTFKQDVDGLTLKGIDWAMFYAYWIGGKDISLCGAAPWLSSYRTDSNYATLLMTLKGDGSNVLVKTGVGKLAIGTAPKDFAAVDVAQGTLMVTDATGADTLCANGVPVNVSSGTLSVSPATSGGSTRIGTLRNGAGYGAVKVANGTLTADSLPKDKGGILTVSMSGSGKFLVSGKESATAPDGGLVSLSGNAISFLDYDAEDGWKAGSSVPANARVFGSTSDSSNQETGALAFDDEGYVWRPAVPGETLLKVTGPISAPGGVTFASAAVTGSRPTVDLSGAGTVNGALRFAGVKVSSVGLAPAKFASTAELSVYSSGAAAGDGFTGTLNFDAANQHHSEPFDFTLRFFGFSDAVYALKAEGNWAYKNFVQQGATEFNGNALIGSPESGSTLCFEGPVVGRGGMTVGSGNVRLSNSGNTFAGDLRVASGAVVNVCGDGTLGTGDVNLNGQSMLYFSDLNAPLTVGNRFLGSGGWLALQNAQVGLTQSQTRFGGFVQDGSTLTLGGDFKAGELTVDSTSTVAADDRDVTLTVGSASGVRFLSGKLKDGAKGGKLGLAKVGADTLVVCGTESAYSGKTEIREGTLRLGGSLFAASDLVFWGDASDASTMTVTDDGKVSEWRSKVGDYAFGASDIASAALPDFVSGDGTYNGHSFVRFTPGQKDGTVAAPYPSLRGGGEIEIRTIALVMRTKDGAANTSPYGALVGYNRQDVSLRVTTTGWITLGAANSSANLATAPSGYQNGVKVNDRIDTRALPGANVAVVMTPRHELAGCGYNHFSKYRPYLGANAYQPWGGDLCEVMMFSRSLSDAERKTVENYLMAKWNPQNTTQHAAADCRIVRDGCLPAATAVELATGATFDLNGTAQTVAALTGAGTIVNSSDTPAVLTVTGRTDFNGRVEGNVTLVVPTGAQKAVLRNGARLLTSGSGTATLTAGNPEPPTHDLAFWLDASANTINYDASGNVIHWRCNQSDVCAVNRFNHRGGAQAKYEAAGWNAGKPAIRITSADTTLKATDAAGSAKYCGIQTLFYVMRPATSVQDYIFGSDSKDVGLQVEARNGTTYTAKVRGASFLNAVGDLVRLNGTDYTDLTESRYSFTSPVAGQYLPLVFVMRVSDSHKNASGSPLASACWFLGSYGKIDNHAAQQYIAEVIGYTTQLSDSEILETEKYLMAKWVTSGTSWPAKETDAYDATCGLGAASGSTLNLGAADVSLSAVGGNGGTVRTSGTISVSGGVFFTVRDGKVDKVLIDGNLALGSQAVAQFINGAALDKKISPQIVLEASGTVTGTFSATDGLPRSWIFDRLGNVWSIAKRGLGIFIR